MYYCIQALTCTVGTCSSPARGVLTRDVHYFRGAISKSKARVADVEGVVISEHTTNCVVGIIHIRRIRTFV